VQKVRGEKEIEARINELMQIGYSIHYHVWNEQTFLDFLRKTNEYLGDCFGIEHYELNRNFEIITILRKKSS